MIDVTGEYLTGWPYCDQDILDSFRHIDVPICSAERFLARLSSKERKHWHMHLIPPAKCILCEVEPQKAHRHDPVHECDITAFIAAEPAKADALRSAFAKDIARPIPASNEIEMYTHCLECVKSKPKHLSPREWARINFGWTKQGIQVWCVRHDVNIIHIDFEGQQHPARSGPANRGN